MGVPDICSRTRGCVLGAALGDAVGAPFEFRPIDDVVSRLGHEWIDDLYPFEGETGAHGVWRSPAPLGTGTDDTRYNWIVLELAAELGQAPTAKDLAARAIEVYERPEEFFPGHADLARAQFAMWEAVGRGVLGQTSPQYPGVPADVLRERSLGLNFPTLIGLISLTTFGALLPGRSEEAYRAAFRADYLDVGYAREAVAILAAAVAGAIYSADPCASVRAAAAMDPFRLGGPFGGPFIAKRLPSLLSALPPDASDQQLAEHLSRELHGPHPFDPYKTLAIAFAAVVERPADPLRAILVAANHRAVNPDGSLGALQDIDCYGCVTGALAGAVAGDGAFPDGVLDQVVAANRTVYGFDLDATVEKLGTVRPLKKASREGLSP